MSQRTILLVSRSLIIIGVVLILLAFGPVIKDELWYGIKQLKGQTLSLSASDGQPDSAFARYVLFEPIRLIPLDRKFGIVIEKIGVNAPIVPEVSVSDSDAYNEALKKGVAQATLSAYPSTDPGNVYLFAHASVNFWDLGKYATVFNLLGKLEKGDSIHIFYLDKDYVYKVINKQVVPGWDTDPLQRTTIEPILTLQTCYPPGTTLNRLIVTSKLSHVN